MMHHIPSLSNFLTNITQQAFREEGLEETFAEVKISDRPDLGDYQCNGPLVLGKKLQKNPRQVGQAIIDRLQKLTSDVTFSLAGPGFINYQLHDDFLLKALCVFAIPSIFIPSRKLNAFIDYGGPNVAKPMHVGHLRSSIIGESLKRLFRFMGHQVIGDVHLGDWGTQMGMLIVALEEKYPSSPYFREDFKGPYPKESPVSLDDLQEIYPVIAARCKEEESLAEKARLATFQLQQGRPGYQALWQHFVDVSVADMKEQFSKLGVSFDQWFGESRYQTQIPTLIQDLQEKGVLEKSEGAWVVSVSEPEDKTEIPPLLIEKSDGGFLYATTDLATIKERVEKFHADTIVYVVDGRQALHFKQVFRAALKAGYQADFEFLGFGTMNGSDNKPFKTRAGGAMRLEELIDTLVTEAKNRIKEANILQGLTAHAIDTIAMKVGVAALKFADLQHNPIQNYQFDLKKFMSFEGKTGPYLLYAVVRIKAILAKISAPLSYKELKNIAIVSQERDLLLWVLRFREVVEKSFEKRAPNMLCDYAFELAQCFSRFYQACPILPEKNLDIKNTRLLLVHHTQQALEKVLDVLGIQCPDKM